MRLYIFLFLISSILLCGCGFDDSFDETLLDDFKSFQEQIATHEDEIAGEYFDVADGYRWIVESNFDRLFSFTDSSFRSRFINLYRNNKITRIEVIDQKCIGFRIRPAKNNSLLEAEWEELWVFYNSGCDCVCHKRMNQMDVPDENITMIEKNWYKVISKNKRYIGG